MALSFGFKLKLHFMLRFVALFLMQNITLLLMMLASMSCVVLSRNMDGLSTSPEPWEISLAFYIAAEEPAFFSDRIRINMLEIIFDTSISSMDTSSKHPRYQKVSFQI